MELGVSFLFLMFLLAGTAEFGIIFFQYVQLQDAAQEGALYGSMYPFDTVSIEDRVRGASQSPIDLYDSDVQVNILFEQGLACEGDGLKVTVVYPHELFMPFLPQLLGTDVIMLRGQVTDTVLAPVCA